MTHRLLVVILDGASFFFCNTFLWMMQNVKHFFHNFHRNMLYIDEPPLTPCVLNTFFTGKPTREHGVLGFKELKKPMSFCGIYKGKYIWDIARESGLKVKVLNIPVRIPPVYLNVDTKDLHWIDMWLPPKDKFLWHVERFHLVAMENVKAEWDFFLVWYPVPDQAHHHFFQAITDELALKTACWWYDLCFLYARQLIEASKPHTWIILSDHGFMNDYEEYSACGVRQHIHQRDALVVTNTGDLPRSPREVFIWIRGHLNI